jgi:lambda family phage portal protein
MASRYLAFIETSDIAEFQTSRGITEDTTNKKYTDTLDELVMEYLHPGEKVNLASHNRPGDAFTPFTAFVLKMLAVSTGVPYELLSGDYSGVNYSTMRVARNDLAAILRPIQGRFIRQLANPVWRRWMDSEVEARRLDLPRYLLTRESWHDARWTSPGLESIDPLKESKAWEQMLKLNLVSPQELAAQRGRAVEAIYEENAEAAELRKFYGLPEPEQGKIVSSKTNPAAITEDDEDE